jgi:hypothetical protein
MNDNFNYGDNVDPHKAHAQPVTGGAASKFSFHNFSKSRHGMEAPSPSVQDQEMNEERNQFSSKIDMVSSYIMTSSQQSHAPSAT